MAIMAMASSAVAQIRIILVLSLRLSSLELSPGFRLSGESAPGTMPSPKASDFPFKLSDITLPTILTISPGRGPHLDTMSAMTFGSGLSLPLPDLLK